MAPNPERQADVGVIGGSGFYAFVDDVREVALDTPYGQPSAPIAIGQVGEARVAFLARHGKNHELPPHRVNFRANVWALKELGVHTIVGSFACGSLQPHIHPGEFVVIDQLIDRTWGRPDTFFDGPDVRHVTFADPYDDRLRRVVVEAGRRRGITVHDGGTVVVIQGPRFATRAESRWYRAQGWEIISMTQYPEAVLPKELDIPYAAVALVTDYDTGLDLEGVEPVTMEAVLEVMRHNVDRVRELLMTAIPHLATR
ncbi:MAG: S-methyl-5'-thioadenosine phosphorylase [Acidimicrobiales bacterium]